MSFGDSLRQFLRRIEKAIDDAGGDPIEALHNHVCDGECWHNAWIGLARPHWLGHPETELEHAFPTWILGANPLVRRKRYFSACKKVMMREPLYYYARKGRCFDCENAIEDHRKYFERAKRR